MWIWSISGSQETRHETFWQFDAVKIYLSFHIFSNVRDFYTFSAEGVGTLSFLSFSSPLHLCSVTIVTMLFIALALVCVAEIFWLDVLGDAKIDGSECLKPFVFASSAKDPLFCTTIIKINAFYLIKKLNLNIKIEFWLIINRTTKFYL